MESLSPTRFTHQVIVTFAVASLTIASLAPPHVSAQDATMQSVADSKLTGGNGIASRFSADENIARHPAVIFADNFEAGEVGENWDEARNRGDKVLAFVDRSADGAPIGRRSLQVTATLGENTGGGMTKWFESSDTIFIRFYTKFDPRLRLRTSFLHAPREQVAAGRRPVERFRWRR